ncbi:MAG: carbohydrate porin [Planctomycetes bacterium]|nr:carbohydrate porin [Planctomycetota bacterium]
MLHVCRSRGRLAWTLAALCSAVGGLLPAQGEQQESTVAAPLAAEDREWIGGLPFAQWSRLSGDWGGWRSELEAAGIEIAGSVTWDWSAAWDGGARNRDSLGALLDVNIAFDLEHLLGLPRTLLWFDAYSIQGRDPSDDVGDVQAFSNLQAPDTDQLAEAWLETWVGDALRVKFGKVDFNSEFAFTEEGGEFVNSSAAITPTILGYPTYPDPATALVLAWQPGELWHLGLGVFDGDGAYGVRTGRHGLSGFFDAEHGDDCLGVCELSRAWVGGGTWGSGRLAVGAWYHSARFDRFDGGTERGVVGGYAVLDQRLWRERPDDAEDVQGVGGMCYVGVGDGDVAEVAQHAEVGLTWTGALAQRDFDVLGVLITHAVLSDEDGAGFDGDETAVELFYKVQVTPAFSLKPDLQWIVNPGGDPGLDDALVATLRAELVF